MHARKNNQTNITKQFTNDNPTSDEMKNTIKTLEELPNYIEKINQKIQHIEKSISKKELDTNRVKAFIQSQSKDNSKLVSERCENELKSPLKKSKQNTDALVLQSIVKASIDNINDVLNFDNNERQRRAKNANQHETLNTKSAYAKASYKKKINEPLYNEKYKKEDKQKRMKLDISSDNLNSLFIQNKRSALKNNSYIDNNNNSKGYYKQNTFMHNTSVNNGNGVTSGNNIKTDINMDDDLSNFLETNEPNPSFLKINKIDKTTSTNRPSKSPFNSNNKNYQFKPKIKQKENDLLENEKQYNTNNTNNKGVVSMISPKSTNKSKNTMNSNYNSNINLKHNKSFIIDKVNTINNIHNSNNTNNTNHYKLNKPTPKKFASFKGPANSKKPHTAHSKKENEPSSSSTYKKNDLTSHNAISKVNPLKTSCNSKNTPSSIRDEASIYYKDIPKQIKNEDLLHLMLFFNEYIISKLPKNISKTTKDAFNNYSLTLSQMIPTSSKQVHKMNIETDMKVKKVINIQRKWREFKVKQIASNTKMNLNNELKKMLINNFIEKEGFGIRKIIGMLNTSVDSFAQLKTKDALMVKLKCINNKELSNDEKNAMYKNYINSKLSVFNNNCRGNTIFNANDDCNYNALLSSVNDINDITQ